MSTYSYTKLLDPAKSPNGWTVAKSINDSGQVVGFYWHFTGDEGFLYSNGTYTNLIDPAQGARGSTVANSINDSGQVVGNYNYNTDTSGEGFLYSNGTYTNLIDPAQSANGSTVANSINDSGQVVGYYTNGTSTEGFLYSNGIYTNLIDPAQSANGFTRAYFINDSGQVVGSYFNGTSEEGFLYSNGIYTNLIDPVQSANGSTRANSINDSGQIVGYYTNGTSDEGFLYSNGVYTNLIDPAQSANWFTVANSINDSGQVVGGYDNGTSDEGFIYRDGIYTTIGPLGAGHQAAIDINNAGEIVGVYGISNDLSFLATPLQAPSDTITWANGISGAWTQKTNWSPQTIPTAADSVSLTAPGTYTVTDSHSSEVFSLNTASGATLKVNIGTFTTDDGTGTGSNAGTIDVRAGASFIIKGDFTNEGTGLISAAGAGSTIELNGGNIHDGEVTVSSGATLNATGANPDLITSPNILVNSGVLESSGTGGLTIDDAVRNAGTGNLFANGDNLTVTGAVTGSGVAAINGAVLEFGNAANAHVMFTSNGTLKLDTAQNFTGTIAGLATTNAIDLANFVFSNDPHITKITGTGAAGTTTNVTISDGALTVTLHLLNQLAGQYAHDPSAYTLAIDGPNADAGTLFLVGSAQTVSHFDLP